MNKIGRPKTNNPKEVRLEIRLTRADSEMLMESALSLKKTKTDIVIEGLRLLSKERGEYRMNAEQARKASEQGAIRAIEEFIEQASAQGLRSVNINDHEISDSFSDVAEKHFRDLGYKVNGYEISW